MTCCWAECEDLYGPCGGEVCWVDGEWLAEEPWDIFACERHMHLWRW